MTDSQTTTPQQTAKPSGISLYEKHKAWLQKEAERQAGLLGKRVSKSEIIQGLIDKAMKTGGK